MNNIGLDQVQTDENFNLKNLMSDETNDDDISPYHNSGHTCKYYELEEFQNEFHSVSKQMSFLSQNIRSLPGKWSEFGQFISDLNKDQFKFSVIALQEIWNVPKGINFIIPGYKPLHYTIRDSTGLNNNAGGGVGLFVDENYDFEPIPKISIFEPHIFESQFVKVKISPN